MEKEPFFQKMLVLQRSAVAYIQEVMERRGPVYELTDIQEEELNTSECVPILVRREIKNVSAYTRYYVCVLIDWQNLLAFSAIPGEEREMNILDLSTEELMALADRIYQLENQ